MIFGMLNSLKISYENLTDFSTSPVRFSHFTLGNPKKSHFQQYYPYIGLLLIIYVISEENKLQPTCPATLPENVTTLTCKTLNFFIWMKVCFIPSNVGLHWWLWEEPVDMCSNSSSVTASVQTNHPLHPVFCHWSTASYTTLCWNSAHVATAAAATRPCRRLVLDTRAPSAVYPDAVIGLCR